MKKRSESYPRLIGGKFNPLLTAFKTEERISKGDKRKYTAFYATGVYGGIATGYTVGCCFRCLFCWTDWSRDFPELFGRPYGPKEAFSEILKAARRWKFRRARISGGEPTLCREHLLGVLEEAENCPEIEIFLLETNGILFGRDPKYVDEISKFKKVHVRVSLKAGSREGFEKRTGASREFFELPFQAVRKLWERRIDFHVAAMTDPRLMPGEERKELLQKLLAISPVIAANLEEEICDPYEATIIRLHLGGYNPIGFFQQGPGKEEILLSEDPFFTLLSVSEVEGEDYNLEDLYRKLGLEFPEELSSFSNLPPCLAVSKMLSSELGPRIEQAALQFLEYKLH